MVAWLAANPGNGLDAVIWECIEAIEVRGRERWEASLYNAIYSMIHMIFSPKPRDRQLIIWEMLRHVRFSGLTDYLPNTRYD